MEIDIQRRATIALRSLEQHEQNQVLQGIQALKSLKQEDIYEFPKLKQNISNISRLKPKSSKQKINTPRPPKQAHKFSQQNQSNYYTDKNYYLYQVNSELHLILSIANCRCIVEDIMAEDKLKRLVANLNKQ